MQVTRFILRRLIFSVLLIFGVSVIVFALVNAVGNPIAILLADRPGISPQAVHQLTAYYGLDKPATTRYLIWAGELLRGNFGRSLIYNQPVWALLSTWGLETLKIQVPAIMIALAVATGMAVTASVRQYSRVDFGVMTSAMLGQSLPGFFVGILLILIFSYWLGIFPSYGAYSMRAPLWGSPLADALWHMVLPVTMLAFFNTAALTLLMRSNLVDILRQDFVTAARASGLPERRIIYGHALRNALIPVLTYLAILMGLMLGTAPVTETVFTWPGVGYLYINAIQQLDYPVILGVTMAITVMLVAATLLTDIAYVFIDPRIRLD